jgi:hypothetical protein
MKFPPPDFSIHNTLEKTVQAAIAKVKKTVPERILTTKLARSNPQQETPRYSRLTGVAWETEV